MSAPVVSCRRILHPGKARADRVATAMGPRPRRAMAWLAGGQTMHAALVQAYTRFGVRAGAFYLLGGRLSTAAYHVAGPQTASARAVEYGPPTLITGGATIIRATGSYGDDLSGSPLLHVHGALADDSGRAHGGHINPDLCIIGPDGVRAIMMLTVGFKQVVDPETHFSLFFPFAEAASHGAVQHLGNHHRASGQRAVGAE